MASLIVRAGRLLARPGVQPTRVNVDVRLVDRKIESVGPATSDRFDLGGDRLLAMPPVVNAHDHGRGVRPIAYGAVDDALEVWLAYLAAFPKVDPYLVAATAFARMALAGVSTVIHAHAPSDYDHLPAEAEAVRRAARDVGIRVAFVVPIKEQNTIVYGDSEPVRAAHRPEDWEQIAGLAIRYPSGSEQVERVDAIAAACAGDDFQVQFGPVGPQWCEDRTLESIAESSERTGRRVHMHLLETRPQREWSDARYPQGGLVRHLDAIGLLSPRLTVAHGVWLKPDECDLLAERGVTVAINTSSNLRLRSGMAPVHEFRRSRMPWAIGLDGLSFDDDDDALRELRLVYHLHKGLALDDGLTPAELFGAATATGFKAFNGDGDQGAIAAGRNGDVLLLDYERMAEDVVDASEVDVLLTRVRADYVHTLVVSGRAIVRDGRIARVDLPALEAELKAQARADAETMSRMRPLLQRHASVLRRYYRSGLHRPAKNHG